MGNSGDGDQWKALDLFKGSLERKREDPCHGSLSLEGSGMWRAFMELHGAMVKQRASALESEGSLGHWSHLIGGLLEAESFVVSQAAYPKPSGVP